MEYNFRNLVFEGGGVKGIAYAGALQVLDEKKILEHIKRVGGTSAGEINAVLLGLGYSIKEVTDILNGLYCHNFLDDSWVACATRSDWSQSSAGTRVTSFAAGSRVSSMTRRATPTQRSMTSRA